MSFSVEDTVGSVVVQGILLIKEQVQILRAFESVELDAKMIDVPAESLPPRSYAYDLVALRYGRSPKPPGRKGRGCGSIYRV